MRGWREILFKDLKIIWRSRLLFAVLILYPFVFMAVIGLTFSEAGRPIEVGMVNLDVPGEEGGTGGESIWIEGEPYHAMDLMTHFLEGIAIFREYTSEEEALDGLREGKVGAVLVLPEGFVHQLKLLNETATVKVVIDQSNMMKAASAEASIRGALSHIDKSIVENKMRVVISGLNVLIEGGDFFGTEVIGMTQVLRDLEEVRDALKDQPELALKIEREMGLARSLITDIGDAAEYLRATAMPLELELTGFAGRRLSLRETMVPTLVGLSILWTGILCAAILLVVEEEEEMRKRLRLTRLKPLTLIASKLSISLLIVFFQAMVMCVVAYFLFHIYISNLLLSLLVTALASLSSIGVGILIASYTREITTAIILSALTSFTTIFVSGAIFPLDQMPRFMQVFARLIPFTWAIDALNGVMLRGDPASHLMRNIGAVLLYGLALIGTGAMLHRRLD